MKSENFKSSPELLRNQYPCTSLGMPIIAPEKLVPLDNMISFLDMRANDDAATCNNYLVHFFKNDFLFHCMYSRPNSSSTKRRLQKMVQYTAVASPDFSVYPEMPLPVQQMQVFKNRWCAAQWQSLGLNIYPTVTWASKESYLFCFDGLPTHSTVVVSTFGCHTAKADFLSGYNRMLEVLQPEHILCYGEAFSEMEGDVRSFAYHAFRKRGE